MLRTRPDVQIVSARCTAAQSIGEVKRLERTYITVGERFFAAATHTRTNLYTITRELTTHEQNKAHGQVLGVIVR